MSLPSPSNIGDPPAGVVQTLNAQHIVTERCAHCNGLLTRCTSRTLRVVLTQGRRRFGACPDCRTPLDQAPEIAS